MVFYSSWTLEWPGEQKQTIAKNKNCCLGSTLPQWHQTLWTLAQASIFFKISKVILMCVLRTLSKTQPGSSLIEVYLTSLFQSRPEWKADLESLLKNKNEAATNREQGEIKVMKSLIIIFCPMVGSRYIYSSSQVHNTWSWNFMS